MEAPEFSLPGPLLVVGAGGIGCEVLISLVGVFRGSVVIVDGDTIELSNLNRQSLFREADIGASKAEVAARETETRSGGRISARFFSKNLLDPEFTPAFFRGFFGVVSCLDNLEAREHLNRMALFGNVRVIESGSTGFLGQAYTMHPKRTECFACSGARTEEALPVCTLRGTPTEWKHCVHWTVREFIPQLKKFLEGEDEAEAGQSPGAIEAFTECFGGRMSTAPLRPLIEAFKHASEVTPPLVHAFSALRAQPFGVPVPELFRTENIVSSTVPSVVTTNAIVSALVVLEVRALLRPKPGYVHYLTMGAPLRHLPALPPNPLCGLCFSNFQTVTITEKDTLCVLIKRLTTNEKSISAITKDFQSLLYDEEFPDNLQRPLRSLGVRSGTILTFHPLQKNLESLENPNPQTRTIYCIY
ncbi:ubiquitin-like 1-activating enzyme E1 B [Nematocida displodere]|uniref:Ubiquitin-like 1-activating enzyme E1 B n=1 Tax=Nematocida displodere TaxID=1805483 RepID=A0A177EFJ4_9MICR|nr:ubiquitin-like 1-activating enzyme E1 B [Nematocida displodere]OAG32262.1 ubiquitin-like 1-activating enzyme E1 B [Nematocida displodere]